MISPRQNILRLIIYVVLVRLYRKRLLSLSCEMFITTYVLDAAQVWRVVKDVNWLSNLDKV